MINVLANRWRHFRFAYLKELSLNIVLLVIAFLVFIPIIMMVIMAFKTNAQIYTDFWGLPAPWMLEYFVSGAGLIAKYILNTLVPSLASVFLVVFFATLSGYAFSRLEFPGREFFFTLIIVLLMVPSILTLIPTFVLINDMGLINSSWALILPWSAHGQALAVMLSRTFFAGLPQELFDSARVDGATDLDIYFQIAMPLSKPVIATIAIWHGVASYNDYIWPLISITDNARQVVSVALQQFISFTGELQYGPMLSAYIIATLPVLILFVVAMRSFINGITSGAIKS
jgi:multiple sugar transport system permease protein